MKTQDWKEEFEKKLSPNKPKGGKITELNLTEKGYEMLLNEIDSLLTQAIQKERAELRGECQKEMYKALEEVAQYSNDYCKSLVNKADIKVWIHSLALLSPQNEPLERVDKRGLLKD